MRFSRPARAAACADHRHCRFLRVPARAGLASPPDPARPQEGSHARPRQRRCVGPSAVATGCRRRRRRSRRRARRGRRRERPRRPQAGAHSAHRDKSPLALANRAIGGLAPADKADRGQAARSGQGPARPRARRRGRPSSRPSATSASSSRSPSTSRCPPTGTRAARGTRWRRCPSASPTSSSRWAGRSPRGRSSRRSGSTSTR